MAQLPQRRITYDQIKEIACSIYEGDSRKLLEVMLSTPEVITAVQNTLNTHNEFQEYHGITNDDVKTSLADVDHTAMTICNQGSLGIAIQSALFQPGGNEFLEAVRQRVVDNMKTYSITGQAPKSTYTGRIADIVVGTPQPPASDQSEHPIDTVPQAQTHYEPYNDEQVNVNARAVEDILAHMNELHQNIKYGQVIGIVTEAVRQFKAQQDARQKNS